MMFETLGDPISDSQQYHITCAFVSLCKDLGQGDKRILQSACERTFSGVANKLYICVPARKNVRG